jgi:phosphatidylcholine synthase
MNLFSAWLVHLYTATGAIAAFMGITAVLGFRYREAFLWMVAATCIDATDGILARWARVAEHLPGIDGARIDEIVDYLTFVFLPMLLLYHSEALPARGGLIVVSVVLVSSLYGFAATDAKTDDHFFTGFPSYWNIVALYVHVVRLAPLATALLLLALSGLVFWRVGYVYPSRTPVLRGLTLTLAVVWGAMIAAMVLLLPDVPRWLVTMSLFYPAYYVVLSFALHLRRHRSVNT